jgi:hypothetical protein
LKVARANIHVLNNELLELDGIRFADSTPWTDFKLYGEGEAWLARQTAQKIPWSFMTRAGDGEANVQRVSSA